MKRSASAGFTLIEVLIAFLLATIGIFGLLSIFAQAHRVSKQSGRVSELNRLVTEKAEQLRALSYSHSDLDSGTHPTQSQDSQGQNYYAISGRDENYSLRWEVSAGPTDGTNTAETNLKTLQIEATFDTRYESNGDAVPGDMAASVIYRTILVE